jgi:hypothetical protein
MFVDLVNVEKNPQMQKATPKLKKVLLRGKANNTKKADPYGVTKNRLVSEGGESLSPY